MLRYLTAGESHGRALVVIVEGMPAGLLVTVEEIQGELARRRLGYGRGPRMRFEADEVTILGGIRHGRTLGSPIAIEIANTEWPKWETEMSPAPGCPQGAHPAPTRPRRPGGHAEVRLRRRPRRPGAGLGPRDGGPGGRRVRLAKLLLAQIGVDVVSHVVQLGPVEVRGRRPPAPRRPAPHRRLRRSAASTPSRSQDDRGDQGGGQRRRLAGRGGRGPRLRGPGRPGSHVHWDRKLDGLLAQALMSIQAIKAVEFGDGCRAGRPAGLRGARRHRMAGRRGPTGRATRWWLRPRHPPCRGHRGWHHHRLPRWWPASP